MSEPTPTLLPPPPRPLFTLRTLRFVMKKDPVHYKLIPEARLNQVVRQGKFVKIWVEAVGLPKPAAEAIWCLVIHVDKRRRTVVGQVVNDTRRSDYHGIKRNMHINIEFKYIIRAGEMTA